MAMMIRFALSEFMLMTHSWRGKPEPHFSYFLELQQILWIFISIIAIGLWLSHHHPPTHTVFHYWGECTVVPELCPCIQGNGISPCLHCCQVGSGETPSRFEKPCNPSNHCLLWTLIGLCCCEGPTMGLEQVCTSQHEGECVCKCLWNSLYLLRRFCAVLSACL